jgi:hypothetical protein
MMGTTSPACFFTSLAAFFSFGVSAACFFDSLLDFWDLDMVFTPVHVEEPLEVRCEAKLKGVCPIDPIIRTFGRCDGFQYRRVARKR